MTSFYVENDDVIRSLRKRLRKRRWPPPQTTNVFRNDQCVQPFRCRHFGASSTDEAAAAVIDACLLLHLVSVSACVCSRESLIRSFSSQSTSLWEINRCLTFFDAKVSLAAMIIARPIDHVPTSTYVRLLLRSAVINGFNWRLCKGQTFVRTQD